MEWGERTTIRFINLNGSCLGDVPVFLYMVYEEVRVVQDAAIEQIKGEAKNKTMQRDALFSSGFAPSRAATFLALIQQPHVAQSSKWHESTQLDELL